MFLKINNRVINTEHITTFQTYEDFETYGRESDNDLTYGIIINLVDGKSISIGFRNSKGYGGLAKRDKTFFRLTTILNTVELDELYEKLQERH